MAENPKTDPHRPVPDPSPWIVRFADHIPAQGRVLDLACGSGRHSRFFYGLGHPITALDRDTSRIEDMAGQLEVMTIDLEDGRPFPLSARRFAAVIVTNYLHRPLLPLLPALIAPAGILIYETFAQGNERFGKPSNPDYLLRPGELLEAFAGHLRVLAYEDLIVGKPRPAAIQRIAARREVT
ncbi:MAG: SAM-dependent methyltransferase [Pseudomonadota bacterium]